MEIYEHATKLFHMIEGGALIINDDSLVEKVRYPNQLWSQKSNRDSKSWNKWKGESVESAMGLCILNDIKEIKSCRKMLVDNYRNSLESIVTFQEQNKK